MAAHNTFGLGADARILFGSDGNGAAVSSGTPVVSALIDCRHLNTLSFQLIVPAGTLEGAWLIEGSNNYSNGAHNQPINAGNWAADALTPPAATAAGQNITVTPGTGTGLITERTMRITFTRTAGSGVPQVWAFGKGT